MRYMAKKKGSRKPKLLTKVINAGILLLAFSRPIQMVLAKAKTEDIVNEATMGFSQGSFRQDWAMQFYGPMLAAIILKKAISMVRKTARI